ncbi:shikimate dehydrogenase family protein [Streptomyces hoynatensis]|uniref:Shikimate dehydrogenase n=1 Tax=Streptomyces hoynatensis TaxID=1141874 RepID=A0A3A9YU12_9ACTN|nr:shikimate dehydrogenase [Streptomyces hoynatensis]RKN39485.1 shikimate dehydrogenase [Streptomyces hoynatensis]
MTLPVLTARTLVPAAAPTLYFIGVSTGRSSIQRVFPRWAEHLGLDGARLRGIDLPLDATREEYRRVVEFIAGDELSLGALITTHKLNLYRACQDLFEDIDPHARLMAEASCLSKPEGRLTAHAKDAVSSGLALRALLPEGHWAGGEAEALCLGAGGATVAISWYLTHPDRGADRPRRLTVTDRSAERLAHLGALHERTGTGTELRRVLADGAERNDAALAALPPGSLVVNATGLGKDAPGSPLTAAATFPERGLAWDLNYRGDLVFLDQARAQAARRSLRVADGWVYFLHGWTQVIAEVFRVHVPESGPRFEELSVLAGQATNQEAAR